MTNPSSTPGNKNKTLILLALCGLLTIAAAAIGVEDNPPGAILAYLAAIAFVLAFVHPWRSARPFLLLLLGSVIGIVLFVILDILFVADVPDPATMGAFQKLMQGLADSAFLLGGLIIPAGFVVGAIGAVAMFVRGRRRST